MRGGHGRLRLLAKPFEPEVLDLTIQRAYRLAELQAENRRLQLMQQPDTLGNLITRDPEMMRIARTIDRVASSDATVMLLGESGTGKGGLRPRGFTRPASAAAGSWRSTARRSRRTCSRASSSATSGAPSPARRQTPGKIETAHNGTLMLDEIGDLPQSLQAKLLRFLEQRTIERLGGRSEIPVDVRVVCATHQDLKGLIAEGRFRDDLYYRLAEIVVTIPPLRRRLGDAVLLAHAFLRRFAQEPPQRARAVRGRRARHRAIRLARQRARAAQRGQARGHHMCEGDRVTGADLGLPSPVETAAGERPISTFAPCAKPPSGRPSWPPWRGPTRTSSGR